MPPEQSEGGPYRYREKKMLLSPELCTGLAVFATLVAALSWLYAVKCWSFCRDTEQFIKTWRKEPGPGVAKLTKIETELTELTDSIEALHVSLRKLRSRVGMRENRASKSTTDGQIPDSATDPAGYKRAMRLKLRGTKL